jgi:hypothetical protein
MDILITAVICILILIILVQRGKIRIKNFTHKLEVVLRRPTGTMLEKVYDAKDICRSEPGMVAYFGYIILSVFEEHLRNQEKNK